MSEPLDADQVARHEFSLGFRGFDQNEVRAFLGRVAAELAVAGEREARLREQVAQLEAAPAPELDEAALEAALGHEATKVIHAARGAAAEIRANAEQSGEALRAEVDAAIAALRSDTERRAAGILEESRAKAAAMLIDANAERARVLDDTRAQRDAMRAELDALRAARARLTGAYDSVRRALDTTARDVADADAAAGAVVAAQPVTDLAPEAGPSEEAEAVVETIDWSGAGGESEPEPELDVPEPEPEPEAEVDAPAPTPTAPDDRRSSALRLLRREVESTPVAPKAPETYEGVRIIHSEPQPEAEPEPVVENGIEIADGIAVADDREVAVEVAPEDGAEVDDVAVDDLFARLRADRAGKVASAEAVLAAVQPDPQPQPEPEPEAEAATATATADQALLATRDEAVVDAERGLVRSMKRALADEQNEVLDALRRLRGAPSLTTLLPEIAVHDARYGAVLSTGAAIAAKAGGEVAGGDSGDASKVAAELGHNLASDIRIRVERAVEECSGDVETLAEAISSTYREWKTARVERLARDAITAAFASGVYAGTSGALRWIVDPAEGGCPDCDDNVLAGATAKGTPFPTGVLHPPAHIGCRCVAVAAT